MDGSKSRAATDPQRRPCQRVWAPRWRSRRRNEEAPDAFAPGALCFKPSEGGLLALEPAAIRRREVAAATLLVDDLEHDPADQQDRGDLEEQEGREPEREREH